MKIAFIGLGHMGGPMALNLHKAGHEVRAFDLSKPRLRAARGQRRADCRRRQRRRARRRGGHQHAARQPRMSTACTSAATASRACWRRSPRARW